MFADALSIKNDLLTFKWVDQHVCFCTHFKQCIYMLPFDLVPLAWANLRKLLLSILVHSCIRLDFSCEVVDGVWDTHSPSAGLPIDISDDTDSHLSDEASQAGEDVASVKDGMGETKPMGLPTVLLKQQQLCALPLLFVSWSYLWNFPSYTGQTLDWKNFSSFLEHHLNPPPWNNLLHVISLNEWQHRLV